MKPLAGVPPAGGSRVAYATTQVQSVQPASARGVVGLGLADRPNGSAARFEVRLLREV